MATKRRFKSAAVQELYEELIGDDAAAQEEFEQELINVEAAQLLYDMRRQASLSQRELARRIGIVGVGHQSTGIRRLLKGTR